MESGVRSSHPKKCCVPKCEDWFSKRHRFPRPDKEPELFKLWMDKVKNPLFSNKSHKQIHKNYLVCDIHFKDEFKVVSHRGLSKIAYPTIQLGKICLLALVVFQN